MFDRFFGYFDEDQIGYVDEPVDYSAPSVYTEERFNELLDQLNELSEENKQLKAKINEMKEKK